MLRRATLQSGGTPKAILFVAERATAVAWLLFFGAFAYALYSTHPDNVEDTRVSENAFLPGAVRERFDQPSSLSAYAKELKRAFKNGSENKFILEALTEIGLEAYNQTFRLSAPYVVDDGAVAGENFFGIMRTPNSAPVESVVMVVPFDERHLEGTALALTMAKYFMRQVYWARDIIVLFAHPSPLAMEAWLAAFHGHEITNLEAAPLGGRAGPIIGAFIFDFPGQHFRGAELKFYGVNGRQPNLDLINVIHRIAKQNHHFDTRVNGLAGEAAFNHRALIESFLRSIYGQTFTEIDGLHSVFGSYGISAVTVAGTPAESNKGQYTSVYDLTYYIEACFRSLNNVLEKLHQSYFLYYLLSPYKFLSPAFYMPIVGIFLAALIVLALKEYFRCQKLVKPNAMILNGLTSLALYFVTVAAFSTNIVPEEHRETTQFAVLFGGPAMAVVVSLLYPIRTGAEFIVTRFVFFVYMGLLIGAVSLVSISLGLCIGVIALPVMLIFACLLRSGSIMANFGVVLAHPLLLLLWGQFLLAHVGVEEFQFLLHSSHPFHAAFQYLWTGMVAAVHKHLVHASITFPLYCIFLNAAFCTLTAIARFPEAHLLHKTKQA